MARRFERVERGWIRRDPGSLPDYCFVTAKGDESPTFIGYHAECGWCFLGAPHTRDAHAKQIQDARVRDEERAAERRADALHRYHVISNAWMRFGAEHFLRKLSAGWIVEVNGVQTPTLFKRKKDALEHAEKNLRATTDRLWLDATGEDRALARILAGAA
jgi:hypothetical protein